MKENILISIRLTLVCLLTFSGAYTGLIYGLAQAAPEQGRGETVFVNHRVAGYRAEGQSFTEDKYFNGRPSAVNYNAAGSGGSNKGPSNPAYLQEVKNRIDTFLLHNHAVSKQQIPSELVTASGSGLDPDLSPEGAYVQVERIAKVRGVSPEKIRNLVAQHIEKKWLSPDIVNVLQLNIDLDKLK